MISIMLISENEREKQILRMAFEQYGITVLISRPDYANYIKAVQYLPDAMFIEMPRLNTKQVRFIRSLQKHPKTAKIPIIGYGEQMADGFIRGMQDVGLTRYMHRPVKFSSLMQLMERYLSAQNKSLDDAHKRRKSEKEFDISLILAPQTLPTRKIELMVKHIADLMAFPFTVAKVLHLTASEKTGASELARVIEADPVIATNLLKFSNTVFFASLNRRISSVKDAIVRIGFRETKRIVMSMSVMNLFPAEGNSCGFDRKAFWYHCLASAMMAEKAAENIDSLSSEEAFLAGLLHDFGIIILDEFFPTIFEKILKETTDNAGHFVAAEIDLLSISHVDLTKELFTHWKIPSQITEAVGRYLDVYESDQDIGSEGPGAKMAVCTAIGNAAAKSFAVGAGCDQYVLPIENWAFKCVKMSTGFNHSHRTTIGRNMRLYEDFLKLGREGDNGQSVSTQPLNIGILNPGKQTYIPSEIYLQGLGHRTVRIPKTDSYQQYRERFDALLFWADEKTGVEDVLKAASTVSGLQESRGSDLPVPLLTFYQEDSLLSTHKKQLPGFSFSKAFDLRHVEEFIHTINQKDE
ncbi:MAG: HDOD domain-containing protein [Chitinivibrionales bacterium]